MGKRNNKVSAAQRWALWTVYGMKCFWCKKALEFVECKIDHVIPESTSKIVLARLVKDYQLNADFSLDGYDNLVPSRNTCSKSKSKAGSRPGAMMESWFESIQKNAERVLAKVHQIEADTSAESCLRQLVELLQRGEITPESAERIATPFLSAVEGKAKAGFEFRLSPEICLLYDTDGARLKSVSEIRYQKLVEHIVESGEWKKNQSPEQLREGRTFGEGSR